MIDIASTSTPALPGLELPEYHGRPAEGMKSSITGAGNRIFQPHEIGARVVCVVEIEVTGSGHGKVNKKLIYKEALTILDVFEVQGPAAARLLSAMRESYRTAEDTRMGRTPLAPGMGATVHMDESGNILGPPDLAAVRGDPVRAMNDERVAPAVVVYSDGAREVWPDEFPKDAPRPEVGERFNVEGDGSPVYVEKLLDAETGETIAEWTREQEDARLLAEEAAALAAEAVVDGGYVGPTQDVPGERGMTATGGDTEAEEAAPLLRDEEGVEPGAQADDQVQPPAPSVPLDQSASEFVARPVGDVVADLPHVQSLDAARLILQAEYNRRTKQRRSVVDAILERIAVLEASS